MPDPDQQARGRLGGQASVASARARMMRQYAAYCDGRARGLSRQDAAREAGISDRTAERYERSRAQERKS